MRKLREIPRGDFVPARNETFDGIIQPVRGQLLIKSNPAREFANRLGRLKQRIHILRCQPGCECEHHDRAAEETNLAGEVFFAELIG